MKWVALISAAIYGFIKALKFTVGIPDLIDSYATDLLCLPLVLSCALVAIRFLFRDQKIVLSIGMIIVAFVAFSVLFEWILPSESVIYTADLWDVVAYGLGGICFYFLQKKIPTHTGSLSEANGDLSMKEGGKSLS